MKTEYRFLQNAELRASGAGRIEGFAAVFNQLSENLGGFRERIRPGAFRNSLSVNDVVGLFNHDTGSVLGRVSARTMQLSETDVGLKTSIDLPATSLGRDVYEPVKRGDLKGMSFGFNILKDEWLARKRSWSKLICTKFQSSRFRLTSRPASKLAALACLLARIC